MLSTPICHSLLKLQVVANSRGLDDKPRMMELNLPFSDPAPVVNDVEEPSVLEYAREQGICVDYTTDLPRLLDLRTALECIDDRDIHDHFDDDLTNAATAAEELTKQKLGLNREGALILKSALALQGPLDHDPLDVFESQQWIRDMKQELPILHTDSELDMLDFGSKVEHDFKDIQQSLPSEILDEEKDEGLGWPAKYLSYPLQYDAMIRNERLAVTREAMTFLQDALIDDHTPEDSAILMAEALESREVGVRQASNLTLTCLESCASPSDTAINAAITTHNAIRSFLTSEPAATYP